MRDESGKKSKRLMRLYNRLQSGQSIRLQDLAEEFGVHVRTMQRYIRDLQDIHEIPLYYEDGDHPRHYKLVETARKYNVSFTEGEMISLLLSLRMMQPFEGTGLHGYLTDFSRKIIDRLNDRISRKIPRLQQKLFALQPFQRNFDLKEDTVDEVLSALIQDRKLDLHYQPVGKPTTHHRVRPYCLLSYKSGLYLVAMLERHADTPDFKPTVFALERILDCERSAEAFVYPEDFNPETFLPELGGMMNAPTEHVCLEFAPRLKPYLEHVRWPGTFHLIATKAGPLRLTGQTPLNEEFFHWLMGFGSDAKVLEPASLRERLVEHLEKTLSRYRQQPQ